MTEIAKVEEVSTDDNEALLQEMILQAEKAAEPGELKTGTVLSKGDGDDSPAPMIAFFFNFIPGRITELAPIDT